MRVVLFRARRPTRTVFARPPCMQLRFVFFCSSRSGPANCFPNVRSQSLRGCDKAITLGSKATL